MILIADCGSTKIDWCLVENSKVVKQVFTCGMNAIMLTQEEMAARIATELVPEIKQYVPKVTSVYFYGAGCINEEVCANVAEAIRASVPAPSLRWPPTLAAARALCGRSAGIACILVQVAIAATMTAKRYVIMCHLWVISSVMRARVPFWAKYCWVMYSRTSCPRPCAKNSSNGMIWIA